MAGYIDVYDIMAKMQHLTITATSDPSITEVTDMIDQVEAEMDARFNAVGIDIPITGDDKIEVVEPIAINGVCAEVMRSIGREPELAATRQKLFDDAMKRIEKNPSIVKETGPTYGVPGGSSRSTPRLSVGRKDW